MAFRPGGVRVATTSRPAPAWRHGEILVGAKPRPTTYAIRKAKAADWPRSRGQ